MIKLFGLNQIDDATLRREATGVALALGKRCERRQRQIAYADTGYSLLAKPLPGGARVYVTPTEAELIWYVQSSTQTPTSEDVLDDQGITTRTFTYSLRPGGVTTRGTVYNRTQGKVERYSGATLLSRVTTANDVLLTSAAGFSPVTKRAVRTELDFEDDTGLITTGYSGTRVRADEFDPSTSAPALGVVYKAAGHVVRYTDNALQLDGGLIEADVAGLFDNSGMHAPSISISVGAYDAGFLVLQIGTTTEAGVQGYIVFRYVWYDYEGRESGRKTFSFPWIGYVSVPYPATTNGALAISADTANNFTVLAFSGETYETTQITAQTLYTSVDVDVVFVAGGVQTTRSTRFTNSSLHGTATATMPYYEARETHPGLTPLDIRFGYYGVLDFSVYDTFGETELAANLASSGWTGFWHGGKPHMFFPYGDGRHFFTNQNGVATQVALSSGLMLESFGEFDGTLYFAAHSGDVIATFALSGDALTQRAVFSVSSGATVGFWPSAFGVLSYSQDGLYLDGTHQYTPSFAAPNATAPRLRAAVMSSADNYTVHVLDNAAGIWAIKKTTTVSNGVKTTEFTERQILERADFNTALTVPLR